MDVSIIVPLYKGKKYIPHITEMVRDNQKVLEEKKIYIDIEIIFINDYPDEKISNNDLSNNENIALQLWENEHNLGIYESRVKGLSMAKGPFIVFLDQDDEISSFYLLRQLQYIGEADAVLCNGSYRDNRRIYKDQNQQRQAICKKSYISRPGSIISPGQMLIRKAAIPINWLNLKIKKNGSDDVLLWILMFCHKKTFAINPFDEYRHIEDGKNTSLDFVNMKESVKELLSVVRTGNLLEDNEDLLLFENTCFERIRKYELYTDVIDNWENMTAYMVELCRTKKNIAVYGYGVLGKRLLSDLENKEIKVDFIIDKVAANFTGADYRIYEPENIPEKVDLIILTPLFDEKQIRKDLCKYGSEIISINTVNS